MAQVSRPVRKTRNQCSASSARERFGPHRVSHQGQPARSGASKAGHTSARDCALEFSDLKGLAPERGRPHTMIHDACWRRPACMTRAYSIDLRERVVNAVLSGARLCGRRHPCLGWRSRRWSSGASGNGQRGAWPQAKPAAIGGPSCARKPVSSL